MLGAGGGVHSTEHHSVHFTCTNLTVIISRQNSPLSVLGYWHQRADERGMATLSHGNQELLVVRDKVGRPQVSLG